MQNFKDIDIYSYSTYNFVTKEFIYPGDPLSLDPVSCPWPQCLSAHWHHVHHHWSHWDIGKWFHNFSLVKVVYSIYSMYGRVPTDSCLNMLKYVQIINDN